MGIHLGHLDGSAPVLESSFRVLEISFRVLEISFLVVVLESSCREFLGA